MAGRDKLAAARAWVHTAPETDAAYDATPARPGGSGIEDTARAWLSLIPEDAVPTEAPRYQDNPAMSTAQNWLALTEPPPPPKSDAGAFERGIYGGYNTLISIFGGAASFTGDVIDDDSLQGWGRDIARDYGGRAAEWSAETPSIDQVFSDEGSFGDFLSWAGYHVSSGGVTAAPALLAGALGAVTSPAIALAAGGAFLYGMGVGDITATQLENQDDPDLRWAAVGGVPYAIAERLFGAGAVAARALTGQQKRQLANSIFRRIATNVPYAMGSEAAAEGAQTIITEGISRLEQGVPIGEVLGDRQLWRAVTESMAAGAVGGAPFGGVAAIPGPRVGDAKEPGRVDPGAPERPSAPVRGERARREPVAPPSQEDIDSPINTEDIQRGREIIADAGATGTANDLLTRAEWPTVGTEVTVEGRLVAGGKPFEARVIDAADLDGLTVATVQDTRTGVTHYIDQGEEVTFTPLPPPDQREAQAQLQADQAELEQIQVQATEAGFDVVFNQAQFDELSRLDALDIEEVDAGQRKAVIKAVGKRVDDAQKGVEKALAGTEKRLQDRSEGGPEGREGPAARGRAGHQAARDDRARSGEGSGRPPSIQPAVGGGLRGVRGSRRRLPGSGRDARARADGHRARLRDRRRCRAPRHLPSALPGGGEGRATEAQGRGAAGPGGRAEDLRFGGARGRL